MSWPLVGIGIALGSAYVMNELANKKSSLNTRQKVCEGSSCQTYDLPPCCLKQLQTIKRTMGGFAAGLAGIMAHDFTGMLAAKAPGAQTLKRTAAANADKVLADWTFEEKQFAAIASGGKTLALSTTAKMAAAHAAEHEDARTREFWLSLHRVLFKKMGPSYRVLEEIDAGGYQ